MIQNGKVVQISDGSFGEEVLASAIPVLVDFWAPWCGPCRIVTPIIEELAEECDGKLKITKLNVDEGQRWAARFAIRGIPTLILFKDGSPVDRIVGAASKDSLRAFVEKALQVA